MEETTVTLDNKGLLHRLFGWGRHETTGATQLGRARPLDLDDIQGFVLRGYKMPMVRHFLLKVGAAAAARKLLGRFVSGDESAAPQITTAEDWRVGFEPGPGDSLADVPRRKPDYCLNIGITWPGLVALEVKDRVPTLSFKSFGAFVAGRHRPKRAAKLDQRIRKGKRSCNGDAACHSPRGDGEL